jgi:hypothetical protein
MTTVVDLVDQHKLVEIGPTQIKNYDKLPSIHLGLPLATFTMAKTMVLTTLRFENYVTVCLNWGLYVREAEDEQLVLALKYRDELCSCVTHGLLQH